MGYFTTGLLSLLRKNPIIIRGKITSSDCVNRDEFPGLNNL